MATSTYIEPHVPEPLDGDYFALDSRCRHCQDRIVWRIGTAEWEHFAAPQTESNSEARLAALNAWTASWGGTTGTVRIYTNPGGWTIGKGRSDNGWTIRRPDGTSPRHEMFRSLLAAQLRAADYMGI